MEVETIFFDAGNTLCYPDMRRISSVLGDFGAVVAPDDLRAAENRIRHGFDTREHFQESTDSDRWSTYFGAILTEAGVDAREITEPALVRLRKIHDRANLWSDMPDEVPTVLAQLRNSGFRMAVVSNANGSVEQKMKELGIDHFFDTIVDSHLEGVEKPDPAIFDIAVHRMSAERGRTVHIGDIYHVDVKGAESAGLLALLLDPADVHGDKPVARIRSLMELTTLLSRSYNS